MVAPSAPRDARSKTPRAGRQQRYRSTRVPRSAGGVIAFPGRPPTVGAHSGATGPYRQALSRPSALLHRHGVATGPDAASPRRPWRSARASRRSEEHTYELQALMSVSYARFFVKKKKTKQ